MLLSCRNVVLAAGFLAIAADRGLAGDLTAGRPNIVFILLDNCGQEWLGCYGSDEGRTPHIDALARAGVRFEHCYAPPVCGPSRTVLLTGRYLLRSGFTLHHDAALYGGGGLDPDRERRGGRWAKLAGYRHRGQVADQQPLRRARRPEAARLCRTPQASTSAGLDRDQVSVAEMDRFRAAVDAADVPTTSALIAKIESRYWDPVVLRNGRREVHRGKFGPDVFQEFALAFLERHREQPFLLYYPMVLTHGQTFTQPVVPTPLDRRTDRPHHEMYGEMVAYADRLIGQLVARLDELGLRERTLIFIATDNGTESSLAARRGGEAVRGGLYQLTEAGGDVALLVNGPRLSGGRTVPLADFSDVFPTLCALAGVPLPQDRVLDGRSQAAVIRGEVGAAPPRDWIFNQYDSAPWSGGSATTSSTHDGAASTTSPPIAASNATWPIAATRRSSRHANVWRPFWPRSRPMLHLRLHAQPVGVQAPPGHGAHHHSKPLMLLAAGSCLSPREVSSMSRFPWRVLWNGRFMLCCVLGLAGSTVSADDKAAEPDLKAELPRIAPVEPAAALASFRVAAGFRIEQVAAEPLVTDPVAMAFDENGWLYVVEMSDYPEQAEQAAWAKVRLLVDTDVEDVAGFDAKSTVFVDKLAWPTAVTCYDGGVFVGAVPDILYCKDTDGDGRADIRRVVFNGFDRTNVQGLLNSFTWGLDNRIEGAAGRLSGAVRCFDVAGARPVDISGRDFSFDPRSLDLIATSGGGQYGMSFDDWGRKFVCSNSDHVQQVMFEDRYIARNPYLAAVATPRVSIAADGPAAEIFRASPIEPWRVVRTRLRVAGVIPGPIEGGGRAAGYFTSASGIAIYRGSAAPALAGMAVVGEACGGLVHRKSLALASDGLTLVARRIDDRSELVASTDIWFRPVQLFNAPDGALYVADMYREVIENPNSLAPMIKKHLDLTSGRDRGRIYRIVPDGFSQPRLPRLGAASTAELVQTLAHANAWHRETAARLLYERQDARAVPRLVALAAGAPAALGRLHALYALDGLKGAFGAEAFGPRPRR